MGRLRTAERATDPATGRPLTPGVSCRGPLQYFARKSVGDVRVAKTFETDKLAREWLEDRSVEKRAGTFVDRRVLRQSTVGELVQRFVAEKMQDGGPRRGAREDRGHIPALLNDEIAKVFLSDLNRFHVQAFGDRQLLLYAKSTVVKRLNLLQQVFSQAINRWAVPLPSNPATAEAAPRPANADQKRNRVLFVPGPAEQAEAAALGEGTLPDEADVVYAVMAQSGNRYDVLVTRFNAAQATRQSEVLALRWRDVDLERMTLTLHGTKSMEHQEERGPEVRALMPEAISLLREMIADGKPDRDSLVFPVGNVMAFRVRWGRIVAKAAMRMTGMKKRLGYLAKMTFHDLRHVATSDISNYFPNPGDTMHVTAHRDVRSMNRYYHKSPTDLAEKAAAHAARGVR